MSNDRIWNIEINGENLFENDVSEDIAKQQRDRLFDQGEASVTLRKDGKITTRYIFRNINLAKKSFREEY